MSNAHPYTLPPKGERRQRSAVRVLLLVCLAIPLAGVAIDRLFPLPQEKLNPPSSTLLLDKDGNLLRAFLAPDEMWRLRVESDEISPLLKRATLAYEDRHFRFHPGVNPISILRAAVANIRASRIVQGDRRSRCKWRD